MATITGAGTSGFPAAGANVKVISEVVDFSRFTHTSTETVEVLGVQAGTLVLAAGYNVLTADSAGNSGTLSLGDTDVDRYVAASTPAAAGQETPILATTVPHFYSGADTIDLTVAVGTINAKVNVWAVIADCTGGPQTEQTATIS